jgi:benzoyl-CoA reductase/2-hydroxyglutaryl-CoA dehydratase subunit BcrC/BadD/HgdB
MAKIGITTTVPIEVIYAAGHVPVDLNNVFVASDHGREWVEEAELEGFPRNFCAWIKGIYGAAMRMDDLESVVAVTQGDCSNTHALMETLQMQGMEVVPFAYPYERDYDLLQHQIATFATRLGTDPEKAGEVMERLDHIRGKVAEIDRLTWEEGKVTGFENHLWQISCSDMEGDPDGFEKRVDDFLAEARARPALPGAVRLGYIGVPPIAPGLYDYLEGLGARVIYNETQRQFSLPFSTGDLVEKYRLYSYPYSIFWRLEDIKREIAKRKIAGMIHYVQSFCFRQVEDIILRRMLDVPLLTIELDSSRSLDARTRMRMENFVSMLGPGKTR